MIRITIDLLPHGDSQNQQQLGVIEIINNGEHPDRPDYGSYDIKFNNRTADTLEFHRPGIESHYRKDGWLKLVKEVLAQLENQI